MTTTTKKLGEIYLFCKYRYFLHLRTGEFFKNRYHSYNVPIIILMATVTSMAGFNGLFESRFVSIFTAILSAFVTIGHSLNSFFEYNAKYDAHNNCAIKYINLARYIELSYYCGIVSGGMQVSDILTMLDTIKKELAAIQGSCPFVPSFIEEQLKPDMLPDFIKTPMDPDMSLAVNTDTDQKHSDT